MLLELNEKMNCIDYRISIDYIFQMENNTEINLYQFNDNATSTRLLLCIFNSNNACISSLIIDYYEKIKSVVISSKTKIDYEGKKLNKLLRAICIIIANKLFPEIQYIKSDALNPISAYLMINVFNGRAYKRNGELFNSTSYEEIQRYLDDNSREGIDIMVEINDENIENANNVFDEIIKDEKFECIKKAGGKSKSYHIRIKKKNFKTHKKYKLRVIKKKMNKSKTYKRSSCRR